MSNIEQLINELAAAKHAEAEAKTARVRAEETLLAALTDLPEKGSKTFAATGLKLTVQTGIGYKADVAAIKLIDSDLIKTKDEFDDKAYEKIRESDPELFRKVSEHVTVSAKKPTLTIKLG